jgi:uncharacterized integral membrane protein (TIGR00697 family)
MIPTILVSVAYVAAQILADVASLRVVMFAGMSMDAGTLVYPLTFTLRDMVHKVAGVKATRVLILAAAGINVVMAGLFWLVSVMKPDMSVGLQAEFGRVLAPVWRITLASIVAEVVAEMIDTEAYRFWVEKVTKRYQWLRVLISNAFSVPIDSLIFVWIAFGGVLPKEVIWSIFLANVVVKGATTLISLPGIYLVKERS